MEAKKYDLVVFGATGFTGRLVVDYLYQKYGDQNDLRWAIAARNEQKLNQVAQQLTDSSIPTLVANVQDTSTLDHMCRQTKVLCTTVGPYSQYGTEVLAACVRNSTHYCDLSGEVPWMRKMIDQYHETAKEKGIKLVHSCGFDSIPSDMGVFYLQKKAYELSGQYFPTVKTAVKASKGGLSGGTYASFQEVLDQASKDKDITELLKDPYALNPRNDKPEGRDSDLRSVQYDESFKSWKCPFLMSSINTRIVRRGIALRDHPYGKKFRYEEFSLTGKGLKGRLKAYAISIPLYIAMKARPGSWINKLINYFTPAQGEGPSQDERENGFWLFELLGIWNEDKYLKVRLKGDKDPGYGSTSKMLAEAAVCLAMDDLPDRYGSLTPSTAMGDPLLERLQKNAGIDFQLKEIHR